jgi:hypothetical protein
MVISSQCASPAPGGFNHILFNAFGEDLAQWIPSHENCWWIPGFANQQKKMGGYMIIFQLKLIRLKNVISAPGE